MRLSNDRTLAFSDVLRHLAAVRRTTYQNSKRATIFTLNIEFLRLAINIERYVYFLGYWVNIKKYQNMPTLFNAFFGEK
jgi:hypothetical protein